MADMWDVVIRSDSGRLNVVGDALRSLNQWDGDLRTLRTAITPFLNAAIVAACGVVTHTTDYDTIRSLMHGRVQATAVLAGKPVLSRVPEDTNLNSTKALTVEVMKDVAPKAMRALRQLHPRFRLKDPAQTAPLTPNIIEMFGGTAGGGGAVVKLPSLGGVNNGAGGQLIYSIGGNAQTPDVAVVHVSQVGNKCIFSLTDLFTIAATTLSGAAHKGIIYVLKQWNGQKFNLISKSADWADRGNRWEVAAPSAALPPSYLEVSLECENFSSTAINESVDTVMTNLGTEKYQNMLRSCIPDLADVRDFFSMLNADANYSLLLGDAAFANFGSVGFPRWDRSWPRAMAATQLFLDVVTASNAALNSAEGHLTV
jgi:hypothetical protein